MENLPKYVKLRKSALRLLLQSKMYWRDGGQWGVNYKIKDGKLISWSPDMEWLHKVELVEITRKEYAKDNKGYLPKNY